MNRQVGNWHVRLEHGAAPARALDMRARLFRAGNPDGDRFDVPASHLTVERGGALAACARLTVQEADAIAVGYTAQFYDLRAFAGSFSRALEVGRICLDPDCTDPEVPRLMLAVMAQIVTEAGVDVLYGCSSFPADGAGMVRLAGHVAPDNWRPGRLAPETIVLPRAPGPLPPLLRAWLSLGAGVSDHAVVDRDLDTLHVFTALPVAAIPARRARLLTGMLDPV